MRAALVLIGNLLRVPLAPLWWLWRRRRGSRGWVRLRLERRLLPMTPPTGALQRILRRGLPGRTATSLVKVGQLTRALAIDDAAAGLLIHMPRLEAGWAACQSLRDLIAHLVASGTAVVVHLREGAGQRELFVASAATRVFVAPGAQLQLLGLASQTPYLRGLLDRVGLQPQVHAVGDYKTAGERFEREQMSEPQREQIGALLSTVQDVLDRALADRPGLQTESIAALFERGMWDAAGAVEVGLVDGMAYDDDLGALLAEPSPALPLEAGPYLQRRRARMWQPVRRPPHICVVPVRGTITMDGHPFGRGTALDPSVARLRAAASDDRAVGVILYVDSPGGSALASDLIHHEVERLAAKKPVVAYFGEVAASGGYYVAAAAARIIAQPQTVTGSIGVIGGRLIASALLARVGVAIQTVTTAPHADMFGISRTWSDDERELFARELSAIYRRFLEVVAAGRGRSVEEVEPWASGRVWSGREGLKLGLIDALGGFDLAVDEVRRLLPSLSHSAKERLEPRWSPQPSGEVPPPQPLQSIEEPMTGAWGEFAALERLLRSQERVYCYAPGLPRIC